MQFRIAHRVKNKYKAYLILTHKNLPIWAIFFCSLSHYFTLSRKNKKINPVLISQKDFYNNKKIAHRTRHLMWNAANAKSCLLATTVYSNEASQFLFKYFVFNFLRILLLRLLYYLQWQVTTFKKNLWINNWAVT